MSRTVYFLGIGGIGMSALARYYRHQGAEVYGYDLTPTPLTDQLIREGMQIHFTDDPALIPPQLDLVIRTPAIPADHAELNYLVAQGHRIYKRSEVLGLISREQPTIGVAGTHGKTTTSSMIAHLLVCGGLDPTAFLGGIANNLHSNFRAGRSNGWAVVEADEFDRSFLHLRPRIGIITSTDADHLDIYHRHEALLGSFAEYAALVPPSGHLLVRHGLEGQFSQHPALLTFGIEQGDFQAQNVHIQHGHFAFDFCHAASGTQWKGLTSGLPGEHNVLNAVAAVSVAFLLSVSELSVREALATFTGIRRRFERVCATSNTVYYDDYAHHPEEIRATVTALRQLYPTRRITGIFQPHLYTRTRDFAEGFAHSLSLLDEVLLLPIYPARELPLPGITHATIFQHFPAHFPARMLDPAEALEYLHRHTPDVLLTIGAGDIDKLVEPIRQLLTAPAAIR